MTTKVPIIAATALAAFMPATAGVTTLAHRATQLLHSNAVFRKAVLLEADGSPAKLGHPVRAADSIVNWRFMFDNQKTGDKYKSVSINAIRGFLGSPKGSIKPVLHEPPINLIPKMTLTRAVHLLDTAGWTKGFYTVTLMNGGVEDVEYVFKMVGGKIVAVDAKTGRVSKLS